MASALKQHGLRAVCLYTWIGDHNLECRISLLFKASAESHCSRLWVQNLTALACSESHCSRLQGQNLTSLVCKCRISLLCGVQYMKENALFFFFLSQIYVPPVTNSFQAFPSGLFFPPIRDRKYSVNETYVQRVVYISFPLSTFSLFWVGWPSTMPQDTCSWLMRRKQLM